MVCKPTVLSDHELVSVWHRLVKHSRNDYYVKSYIDSYLSIRFVGLLRSFVLVTKYIWGLFVKVAPLKGATNKPTA